MESQSEDSSMIIVIDLNEQDDIYPPPYDQESSNYYRFVMGSYEDLNGDIVATHLDKYDNAYPPSHDQEDIDKESAGMDSRSKDSSMIIVVDLNEQDDIYPPPYDQEIFGKQSTSNDAECEGSKRNLVTTLMGKCYDVYPPPHAKEIFDKQSASTDTECEGSNKNFVATPEAKLNDVYPPPHAKTNIVYQMRKSPSKTTNSTNFQQSADFSDMADSKYKTALCWTWEKTAGCPDGICCRYAHGESELQPLLPPICRNFAQKGICPYGDHCLFLHEITSCHETEEIFDKQSASTDTECEGRMKNFVATPEGKFNDVYPPPHAKTNIVYQMRKSPSETTNSTNFQQSADFSDMAGSKYKTALCWTWKKTAGCPDGICCKYAHGESELLPLLPPICRNFAQKGICPYGDHCLFLHEITSCHETEILVDTSTWDSSTVDSSQNSNPTTANHYQVVAGSVANSKCKTAICIAWKMTGNCHYGTNCGFAHGESELQRIFQPKIPIDLTPGTDPKVIDQAMAPLKKPQTVKGRGVVCTVEEHQCFVYSYDFLIEPYLLYKDGQTHLRLGQWIDFTAQENLSGIFEIVDYMAIEPAFDTLRCKSTVMVRCFVHVPANISSNSEQPMNSSISRRVLCKNTSIIGGYEGQEVRAILRYSYEDSEVCGYWNFECVATE